MDLLGLVFDLNKSQNTCCLCYTYNENNNNIFDVFEIFDKQFKITISLKNIIVNTLPQIEIFLDQACRSCTDLLIKLYIIVQKSSIKKCFISSMLEKINSKIGQFDFGKKVMKIDLCNQSDVQPSTSVICNICYMNFNTSQQLTKHKELAHKQSFSSTICYICGKKWATTKQLKSHLNSHNVKQCPYCIKMLKTHSHYNKHVRNHLRVRKEVNNDGIILENDFVKGYSSEKINNQARDEIKCDEKENNATSDLIKDITDLKGAVDNSNRACEEKLTEIYDIVQSESFIVFNEENLSNRSKVEVKSKIFEDNNTIYPINSNIVNVDAKKNDTDISLNKSDIKPLTQLAYEAYCNRSTKNTIIDDKDNGTLVNNCQNINSSTNSNIGRAFNSKMTKQCQDSMQKPDKSFDHTISPIQNSLNIDFIENGQNYTTRIKLKSKMKKFYLCDSCPYKSITKMNLEAHYNKIHLCIRPYMCEICLKSFYRKSNLQEHIVIHNNTKNLMCEVCGSNFVNKKTLETHLKTHGVKRFHCDVCNKNFFHKYHLNEHIKRNHAKKLFNCMCCEKKYGLRKDLKRHFIKVH